MNSWILRRAERVDADALAACIDGAYAPYAERLADLPPVSADCAGEIQRHQVWVAEAAGEIIGGLVLAPENGFMLIANLAVRPDHAGAGLGRTFMAKAESEADAQEFRELRLTTHAEMAGTIRFYKRLGWQEISRSGSKVSMAKSI